MYDPIHANRHGVVSVPRTDRTCNYDRSRRYDDGEGGRGAAEETKIGPRYTSVPGTKSRVLFYYCCITCEGYFNKPTKLFTLF